MKIILVSYLLVQGVIALCPETFERHGESCYKIVHYKVSWIDAKKYCDVLGGDLAAIESESEERDIEGMLQRLNEPQTHDKYLYWLDGSDIMSEGMWRWMGKNGKSQLITYSHWASGQPDNARTVEHCLEIGFDYLWWNDRPCSALSNFICEASINWDSQEPVVIG